MNRMMMSIVFAACLAISCVFAHGSVNAEVLILDDTLTVFDGEMYGASGCDSEIPQSDCKYFNMGGMATFRVGKTAAHVSTAYRALMGFDLSDLPDHSCVQLDSAILVLTAFYVAEGDSVLNAGFQSLLYDVIEGANASFAKARDSSFTWAARIFKNNSDTIAWQVSGAKGSEDREDSIYSVSGDLSGTGSYRIDLSNLVDHWLDSSATERWCVLSDTMTTAGGRAFAMKHFWSSEASDSTHRPRLEIYYRTDGRRRSETFSGGILR